MTEVHVVRNATSDPDSLKVFRTKKAAEKWLTEKGLVMKGHMYMYPEQDETELDEYMYWMEKCRLEA